MPSLQQLRDGSEQPQRWASAPPKVEQTLAEKIVQLVEEQRQLTQPRRKRRGEVGRAKTSVQANPGRPRTATPAGPEGEATSRQDDPLHEKPKRGRGRPRKNPAPADTAPATPPTTTATPQGPTTRARGNKRDAHILNLVSCSPGLRFARSWAEVAAGLPVKKNDDKDRHGTTVSFRPAVPRPQPGGARRPQRPDVGEPGL